ncbi:MAG: peptidylprolyl isomerase [Proteobacteria bacterium]|nr:peptidylprolyl isomerase [Pseudomonadota bacterium]
MNRLSICALVLVILMLTPVSRAQDTLSIAAVVNDKVITVYDLGMRLSLVTIFTGLPNTPETRTRLAPQVLQSLIDDELKRQEAKRLKIKVDERDVQASVEKLEKGNKLGKGGLKTFLANRQIEENTLTNQIRASQLWNQLVNLRFRSTVIIADEEINGVLAEMKKNEGKPEYNIAEIFLPVNNQDKEKEILAQAERLIQQVRAGAIFGALAQNFSKSPTAENAGNLGWNKLGQLGAEYDNAMVNLKPGQVSPPIRTIDGYAILFLIGQRTANALGDTKVDSAVVNLQQLFLPIPKGADPAIVDDAMEGAKIAAENAKNCTDLEKSAKVFESPLSGNLGDIKTISLAPQQRTMIRGLPVFKASRPFRTADGVVVLMICRRDEPKSPDLANVDLRERIANRLTGERLSILAQQYLRDIRRTAFIEIR